MAPYHILIPMFFPIFPENLVLLTESEQFGPKSAHICPTTGGYSSKVIYHDFCLQTYSTVVPKLLYGVFIWPFTQSFYCVIFLMK